MGGFPRSGHGGWGFPRAGASSAPGATLLSAHANLGTTFHVPGNTFTKVPIDTLDWDDLGAWSPANNGFDLTARPGKYIVTFSYDYTIIAFPIDPTFQIQDVTLQTGDFIPTNTNYTPQLITNVVGIGSVGTMAGADPGWAGSSWFGEELGQCSDVIQPVGNQVCLFVLTSGNTPQPFGQLEAGTTTLSVIYIGP